MPVNWLSQRWSSQSNYLYLNIIAIWLSLFAFLQSNYHYLHSCNLTIIICIQCSREWEHVSIVSAVVFTSPSLTIDLLRVGSLYQTLFGTTLEIWGRKSDAKAKEIWERKVRKEIISWDVKKWDSRATGDMVRCLQWDVWWSHQMTHATLQLTALQQASVAGCYCQSHALQSVLGVVLHNT